MKYLIYFLPLVLIGCLSDLKSDPIKPQPPIEIKPTPPDFCDSLEELPNAWLCAIKPSRLDARTKDVYGDQTPEDKTYGFGYHALVIPKFLGVIKGVYVHFIGTTGRPYNQNWIPNNPLSPKWGNYSLMSESVGSGYFMIELAYNNRFSVNEDLCNGVNKEIDNCAGLVREENLTGNNVSTISETDKYNSIEYRLAKVNEFLRSHGILVPGLNAFGRVDWSQMRVGGHSQGGNQAWYISKTRGVSHACLFASAFDIPDTINPVPGKRIADWFIEDGSKTSIDKVRGFVHTKDPNYNQFTYGFDFIGLTKDHSWDDASDWPVLDYLGNELNGHRAPIEGVIYSDMRKNICFNSGYFE